MGTNDKIKILIAEDDVQLRDAVSSTLIQQGFEVLSAASGEGALSLIATHKFDVVVSDFTMPKGDGLWLLKKMKELGSSVPFILATGSAEVSETQAKESGAFGVLRKPALGNQYVAMIRAALSVKSIQ